MKEKRDWDKTIELVIVIMLGITALLTAWASWIGSLHGGNQSTNYTVSNNLASEGNSEYNAGIQQMNQDMAIWNSLSNMQIEIQFAQGLDDEVTVEKVCYQLLYMLDENLSERMAKKIGWNYDLSEAEYEAPTKTVLDWMEKPESTKSPFFDSDYLNEYIATANDLLSQSQEVLEQGKKDNANGDAFGLVTVIYSVVLFLLGIAGSFKHVKYKYAVVCISLLSFAIATIYMFTLPLPTGFSLSSFFGG